MDETTRKNAMSAWTPEGPRLAIVLNRDLMFGSRIRNALRVLALEARFVPDTGRFVAALAADPEQTAIGIVDMNGPVAWDTLKDALAGTANAPPTLAFGPHVDAESRRAAKAAGVSRIVSNGQFHRETVPLIDRYRRR
ncbi:MAG: hypothetical protein ACRDJC_04175 [Thermomicrobiales bacterium]